MKKSAALILTALMLVLLLPVSALAAGSWQQLDDGRWVMLDDAGGRMTGWQLSGGRWYVMNGEGIMQTGWYRDTDGTWYFLEHTGAMKTGWLHVGGVWYFLRGSGAMATGWQQAGGAWYYMDADGAMLADTVLMDGGRLYFLDGSGAMVTGEVTLDGIVLPLRSDGSLDPAAALGQLSREAVLHLYADAELSEKDAQEEKYAVSVLSGARYHRDSCRTIRESDTVRIPLAAAIELGFTACGVCKP